MVETLRVYASGSAMFQREGAKTFSKSSFTTECTEITENWLVSLCVLCDSVVRRWPSSRLAIYASGSAVSQREDAKTQRHSRIKFHYRVHRDRRGLVVFSLCVLRDLYGETRDRRDASRFTQVVLLCFNAKARRREGILKIKFHHRVHRDHRGVVVFSLCVLRDLCGETLAVETLGDLRKRFFHVLTRRREDILKIKFHHRVHRDHRELVGFSLCAL
jgi:hypothetical protein